MVWNQKRMIVVLNIMGNHRFGSIQRNYLNWLEKNLLTNFLESVYFRPYFETVCFRIDRKLKPLVWFQFHTEIVCLKLDFKLKKYAWFRLQIEKVGLIPTTV